MKNNKNKLKRNGREKCVEVTEKHVDTNILSVRNFIVLSARDEMKKSKNTRNIYMQWKESRIENVCDVMCERIHASLIFRRKLNYYVVFCHFQFNASNVVVDSFYVEN